jgi:hypothetical protein
MDPQPAGSAEGLVTAKSGRAALSRRLIGNRAVPARAALRPFYDPGGVRPRG